MKNNLAKRTGMLIGMGLLFFSFSSYAWASVDPTKLEEAAKPATKTKVSHKVKHKAKHVAKAETKSATKSKVKPATKHGPKPKLEIAVKSPRKRITRAGAKKRRLEKQVESLMQANCGLDISEVELLAINSAELTGMLEREQITEGQRKIESSSDQRALAALAEGCSAKIQKQTKTFIEAANIEESMTKIYASRNRLAEIK